MYKIMKIALLVVGLISAVLWLNLPSIDMPKTEAINSGAMNFMFIITYILLAIAIVASVVFAFGKLFSSKENLKKTLMGVGGLLVVLLISFILAKGDNVDSSYMAMTTESTVKKIGMGLNMFYILTVIAILAMVLPAVKRMFSK